MYMKREKKTNKCTAEFQPVLHNPIEKFRQKAGMGTKNTRDVYLSLIHI